MNYSNLTFLVTGGAGHIGSHIVDELVKYKPKKIIVYDNLSEGREKNLFNHLDNDESKVEIFRGDLRDIDDINEAMKNVDYVFHVGSVLLLEAKAKPKKALDINITGTYNILNSCVKNKVKKIIFSSTGSVYGDPSYVPTDEDHPYNSETIYGTTKIACEHLLRDFKKSHDLEYIGLRYHNVYGPRQHYKGAYMQIIPKWTELMIRNEDITIMGDGKQTMDMTYVEEVAISNIKALESNYTNGFVNIASGREVSVIELFNFMANNLGYNKSPNYQAGDPNVVKRRISSTQKAKEKLNFEIKIPIEEGIPKYVNWIKDNTLKHK